LGLVVKTERKNTTNEVTDIEKKIAYNRKRQNCVNLLFSEVMPTITTASTEGNYCQHQQTAFSEAPKFQNLYSSLSAAAHISILSFSVSRCHTLRSLPLHTTHIAIETRTEQPGASPLSSSRIFYDHNKGINELTQTYA
jgi:hypothetical protein